MGERGGREDRKERVGEVGRGGGGEGETGGITSIRENSRGSAYLPLDTKGGSRKRGGRSESEGGKTGTRGEAEATAISYIH